MKLCETRLMGLSIGMWVPQFIAGGLKFPWENPERKWMMTVGTPYFRKPPIWAIFVGDRNLEGFFPFSNIYGEIFFRGTIKHMGNWSTGLMIEAIHDWWFLYGEFINHINRQGFKWSTLSTMGITMLVKWNGVEHEFISILIMVFITKKQCW